jgi:hypothetical protein
MLDCMMQNGGCGIRQTALISQQKLRQQQPIQPTIQPTFSQLKPGLPHDAQTQHHVLLAFNKGRCCNGLLHSAGWQ